MKKLRALDLFIGLFIVFSTLPVCGQKLRNESLDGLWLSDGYGMLFEFQGDALRLSEVTSVSCIPAMTGKQLTANTGADFFMLDGNNGKLQILPGASPDEKQAHFLGAASTVTLRRLTQKPTICFEKAADSPERNFEVFWTTFKEHHAFLKERGADWSAAYKNYRPLVNAGTTPRDLFKIMVAMIEPLHDHHTFLMAEGNKLRFMGRRTDDHPLTREDGKQALSIINRKYIRGELRLFCNRNVQYGRLNNRIGYLRILGFGNYTEIDDFENGAKALAEALDEIIADCRRLKALVIDMRLNSGGYDPYGVQVAARLTDEKYIAFVKRARNDPDDPGRFTTPQTTWVVPFDGARFAGRVIELTGIETVSAGETFSMALIGRKPVVTRIGEPTQGVFSDVLVRKLPNGWSCGVPNEVFLTEGGRHYEVNGVPPDITVPVFPHADLEHERDGALERALALLTAESIKR